MCVPFDSRKTFCDIVVMDMVVVLGVLFCLEGMEMEKKRDWPKGDYNGGLKMERPEEKQARVACLD